MTLVEAFISCPLDYWTHFSMASRCRLQSVQNAAVRLVSGARCCDHITPVLQELHCLPVQHRMDFKIATLVYLSLPGIAPAYLAADCQLVSDEGRHQLLSANSRTCVVRRTYSSYGERCFAAAGSRLWNSLPAHLRQTDINLNSSSGCWRHFCSDVESVVHFG